MSPYADRVIVDVLAIDVVDVGSPKGTPARGREALGAGAAVEHRAHEAPVDEVFGAEDRSVANVFGAVEVEETVFLALYHRGVGHRPFYNGVFVCFALDVVVGCGGRRACYEQRA